MPSLTNLDRIFSEYIRKRDTPNGAGQCCTCGKLLQYKGSHCGHFMSRVHQSTRYDEQNCAIQCPFCNTYRQGEQYQFGIYIDRRWGKGTAESLLHKSRMLCKRNRNDILYLTKEFRTKIKEL